MLLLLLSSLGGDGATEGRFGVDDCPDGVLLRSAVLSLSFRAASFSEYVAAPAASLLLPVSRYVLLVIIRGGGRSAVPASAAMVCTAIINGCKTQTTNKYNSRKMEGP